MHLSHRVSDVVHDPRAALVDGEVRELEALGRQFDAVVRLLAPSPPSSPGTDRYGDDDHGNDDGDRRGERGLRGRRGPGAATPSGSGGPLRGRRRNPVVKQRRVYLRDLDGCEGRGDAVRRRRGREGCLGIFRGEGQQRAEDRVGVRRPEAFRSLRVEGTDVLIKARHGQDASLTHAMDQVFPEDCSQSDIYDWVAPAVEDVARKGVNARVAISQ